MYRSVTESRSSPGKHLLLAPDRSGEERLEKLREHYVEVPRLDDLRRALATRRLVVLVGSPGSGRVTTALHLLDDATSGRVSRLAADTEFREIDEDTGPAHGYLVEPDHIGRLSATEADRLADVCARNDCYLVAVALPDRIGLRALGAYTESYRGPEPGQLLKEYLGTLTRSTDPPGTATRLLELVAAHDLWTALGPAPRPRAVAHLASLLIANSRGENDLQTVRVECEGLVASTVAEWFDALHGDVHGERAERARRGVAQRVALAVFADQPRALSAEMGDDLADHWQVSTRGHGRPTRPTTSAEIDEVLLASVGAELVTSQLRIRGSWMALQVVRFTDDRVPSAILDHVWRYEAHLRGIVSRWFHQLVGNGDRVMQTVVGQVVGSLCGVDFSYTFTSLIEPNAQTPRRRQAEQGSVDEAEPDGDDDGKMELGRRYFAAVALDQAAREPALADVVRRLLKKWRRGSDLALRCTAAAALGLDLGLTAIEETLEELRILGTPQETSDDGELDTDGGDLLYVAGRSIARLFSQREERHVIHVLEHWIGHERSSVRLLATQAVLLMAHESRATGPDGHDEADVDAHVSDPRSTWPVLLEVAQRDPVLAGPLALLLRATIRSRPGNRLTEGALGRWMSKAQEDAELLATLEAFLPRMIVDRSDASRLRYLIERRRHDWAEPLSTEIADRLRACTGRHPTREVPA